MTICILCTLRALAQGQKPVPFEQHPLDHMNQYHPDAEAAANEQDRLTDEVMTLALNGQLPGFPVEALQAIKDDRDGLHGPMKES